MELFQEDTTNSYVYLFFVTLKETKKYELLFFVGWSDMHFVSFLYQLKIIT